jgi:hypothetical protein
MKLQTLFYAISFLAFFMYGSASAQNPRDISIRFDIDAAVIFDGGNVEEYSEITDNNRGKSSSGKLSDFESEAYVSKFVNWEINDIGENPDGYQVRFLDFPWTGDIKAFGENPIKANGRSTRAKIDNNSPSGVVKYTIMFTITNKSTGETRTFELDPKIRVV